MIFHYSIVHIMFIKIVFCLGSDRPAGLLFFRAAVFFLDSRLSSYLRLLLYLIPFLMFPCVSIWEDTLVLYCNNVLYVKLTVLLINVYMDGVVREVNVRVLGKGLELVSANGGRLR